MNKENNLVLPEECKCINEEEMRNSEGGWCIERKWYETNIYLTHKEAELVQKGQDIIGNIPGLDFAAGACLSIASALLGGFDKGHGVKLRYTGVIPGMVKPTGIFSLTAKQEKGIASKNKIIFSK